MGGFERLVVLSLALFDRDCLDNPGIVSTNSLAPWPEGLGQALFLYFLTKKWQSRGNRTGNQQKRSQERLNSAFSADDLGEIINLTTLVD
jgi:hypothetical protein